MNRNTFMTTTRVFIILIFAFTQINAKPNSNLIRKPIMADSLLILKNVHVLDVKKGKFWLGKDIVIRSGKIIKIGKAPRKLDRAKVLDLTGSFVIPGLIDAHVHVTAHRSNNIENTYKHLEYFLKHGITSVRDAGGDGASLLKAQTEIREGRRIGSDVYFSSFMAGDWYYNRDQGLRNEPYSPWEQRLVPGDYLDKAMASAKASGATGVKLYHSFDKNFLPKVAKAARRHNLKVWGHTMMYPAKPIEVVKSGVQVLSHVSMLETMKTDTLFYRRTTSAAYKDSVIANLDITEFCREMKAHHAILDATLCVSERDRWVFPLAKRVHQQGVKIVAGTDQIVDLKSSYPRLVDELDYYIKEAGFTAAEAIRSATITGAEVLGQEKNIGSIKSGKQADLLILRNNPLLNIRALENISLVIKSGKILIN
ncbi:amidohydrolase family protein [Pedobacter sp.]|uniref:amidohydrolase family protein n=1 Tax=Pedobacter sp. TaxID=1411316 RepID=UPI003BA991BC